MIRLRSAGTFTGAGLLSALAASLCCMTPILSLLAGSSSIAANFSWLSPARPYFIGLSIAVLGFSWYWKLKYKKTDIMDCRCETARKIPFHQSTTFLGMVTVVAILMMSFPLYVKVIYPKREVQVSASTIPSHKQGVKFFIEGMTCTGCEEHVNNEISKLKGVIAYKTSYVAKSSLVTFDSSKLNIRDIQKAINRTGYRVKDIDIINTVQQHYLSTNEVKQ